jgi:hypothetical protein
MTATIKWSILNLDRNTADGFITTAHWQATGEDDGITSSVYATCSFEGNVTTPYENVTEAQVLEWCWANGVDKEATEAAITARIAELKAPKTASGLPWGN